MRYRKLSPTGDYMFGQGQGSFYINVPDAPAQAVLTRFYLFLGEWFLNKTEGMAWKTKVLGKYTASTRDPVVRARALGTQGVTGIKSYGSQVDRNTRDYTVQLEVDTIYGPGFVVAGRGDTKGSPPGWPPPYGDGPGTGGPR